VEKVVSARFGEGRGILDMSEGLFLNTDTIAA
jgi:hypothetical protein